MVQERPDIGCQKKTRCRLGWVGLGTWGARLPGLVLGQPCEAVWGTLDRQGYMIHTSPGFLA